jgi:hypothetical protein
VLASGSRGAWTDEGLYTAPVRNFINQGFDNFYHENSILKTPYAIVTPLYLFFLFPFFKIFGISLATARLIAIFFCAGLLSILFYKKKLFKIAAIFTFSTLLLQPIHHYTHMCLAEMFSTVLIIAAIVIYAFNNNEGSIKGILLMYLLVFAAILFKIQFIYLLPLPVITQLIPYFSNVKQSSKKPIIYAILFFFILISVIYFIWYLPFKDAWELTSRSSSGRFSLGSINLELIFNNINNSFLSKPYLAFFTLFIFSLFTYIFGIKNKLPASQVKFLNIILLWILLESHKVTLSYLPIRYLISIYAGMGLFSSVVCAYLLNQELALKKLVGFGLLGACILLNFSFYIKMLNSRTYKIQQCNNYMEKITNQNDIVIGPWAPTLTWQTKCTTYPIWAVYTKNADILKTYSPKIIVSEIDQNDSDGAFRKSNLNIEVMADSLTQTQIAFWKINIYRVKTSIK